jgi:ferredoxin-NADP reductase
MSVHVAEFSRPLVELPMLIFLRLTDGDGKMTAREMERFDALLRQPAWCRSPLLRRSIARTEAEKAQLWRRYVDGALPTQVGPVAAALDAVLSAVTPDERADLERDLLHFACELRDAANGAAGFLRTDARTEAAFRTLSDLIRRPSARERRLPQTQGRADPDSTRRSGSALLSSPPGADPFWHGGKVLLRCVHIVDETHDTRTFHFVADPPALFRYRPGQFLTLEVPLDEAVVRRTYTISSSPSRPYAIAVTVKRVEGGRVSSWLHAQLKVGMQLSAQGPNGKFTCVDREEGPYLFVSGGSGITPVMSMARWLCDTDPGSDIHFVYAARTPDDLVFERELRLMEQQCPGFRYHAVCSRTAPDGSWTGRTGRITSELLAEIVPDLTRRAVYLCGPVPFMQSVRDGLVRLNFDMARFAQESFGGVPREPKATEAEAGATATVVFSASGVEVDCKGSDYILDLGLANGVTVAYACRAGQCGSCKVTLIEGSVVHDCADALTSGDAGLVLPCQARPVGRVVLDL